MEMLEQRVVRILVLVSFGPGACFNIAAQSQQRPHELSKEPPSMGAPHERYDKGSASLTRIGSQPPLPPGVGLTRPNQGVAPPMGSDARRRQPPLPPSTKAALP